MFLKDIVELVVAPKHTDGTLPILEWKLAEHRAAAVNHSKFQVVTKTSLCGTLPLPDKEIWSFN